jgi:hypothetical protein
VAERIEGRATSVPAWAWTNLLAHESERDLRSERAVVRLRQVTSGDEWRAARSYLAGHKVAERAARALGQRRC